MAGEVLRRAVHDHVGAGLQRPLQDRRREGVVDHAQRARRGAAAPPAPRGRPPAASGWSASRPTPGRRPRRRRGRASASVRSTCRTCQPAAAAPARAAWRGSRSRRPAATTTPPGGTRSSTAATAAIPDANDVATPPSSAPTAALEHLPGRVAVAAVADLAARVVGRGHHDRRVRRPVRLSRWPTGGDRHRGGGQRPASGAEWGHGCEYPGQRRHGAAVGSARDERPARPDGDRRKPPRRKPRVAVVFGGRSTEHAISCVSAGSVLAAIDRDRVRRRAGRHHPRGPLGAGRRRARDSWRSPAATLPAVDGDGAAGACSPATRPHRGLAVHEPGQVPRAARRGRRRPPAAARPVRRGRHPPGPARAGRRALRRLRRVRLRGRDGQGVHEGAARRRRPAGRAVRRGHPAGLGHRPGRGPRDGARRSASRCSSSPPAPARASASPRCTGRTSSTPRSRRRARTTRGSSSRRRVEGREIECGVLEGLDGGAPEASVPGEIVVGGDHEFYDFEAKYLDEGTDLDRARRPARRRGRRGAGAGLPGVRRAVLRGAGPGRLLRHARAARSSSTRSTRCRASRRCRCSR